MKKLNVFLLIVLLVLIALTVWILAGSHLSTEANIITASAAEHPDAFASIQNVLASGSAPQQFTGDLPQSADGCTLVDVTVTLTNSGLLPAEWLDAAMIAQPGDIAVYSLTGEGTDIPGRSTGQINLKLITTESANTPHTITLRYYVFGMLRTLTVTG